MAKKKETPVEETIENVVAEPTPVQKYDGITTRGYRSPGNLSAPVVQAPVVEETPAVEEDGE